MIEIKPLLHETLSAAITEHTHGLYGVYPKDHVPEILKLLEHLRRSRLPAGAKHSLALRHWGLGARIQIIGCPEEANVVTEVLKSFMMERDDEPELLAPSENRLALAEDPLDARD